MHQTYALILWSHREFHSDWKPTHRQSFHLRALQEHLSNCFTYQLKHQV